MKQEFETKNLLVGTMLSEVYSPNIAGILKLAGFDYFIIDCEHGAYDRFMVSAMISVSRELGVHPIVRVPGPDRENILKYLEMGAAGILVPMIYEVQQVQKVVEFARYAPIGARGISTRRAHNYFDGSDIKGYMCEANERITVLIQIETREALKNLNEIASVRGIDGLIVGPSDLSSALGDFGNFETVAFKTALESVIKASKSHSLHCGIVTSNIQMLRECHKKGMDIICWNSEIGMMISSSKKALEEIKRA